MARETPTTTIAVLGAEEGEKGLQEFVELKVSWNEEMSYFMSALKIK